MWYDSVVVNSLYISQLWIHIWIQFYELIYINHRRIYDFIHTALRTGTIQHLKRYHAELQYIMLNYSSMTFQMRCVHEHCCVLRQIHESSFSQQWVCIKSPLGLWFCEHPKVRWSCSGQGRRLVASDVGQWKVPLQLVIRFSLCLLYFMYLLNQACTSSL